MMELNTEQLSEVQQFAEWLFTPLEIATILEVNHEEFLKEIRKKAGTIFKAFMTGKYKTEAAMRKSAITFMKQGSTPALTETLKMSERQNLALVKA
jgi:hypothetical protein